MRRTIAAVIDDDGRVRLLETVKLPPGRRALVTILDEGELATADGAMLSEQALGADWNRPEEDVAWAHLQRER